MASPATAEQLIERLGLAPHPEGGWYRELHRSGIRVRHRPGSRAPGETERQSERDGLTVIAYLLREGECSRWHRVHGADEVWHHGAGSALQLWRLPPHEAAQAEVLSLGPFSAEAPARSPLAIVPAGWWQAARAPAGWGLVYCSVGPGFDFADFELLRALPPAQWPSAADRSLL